MEWQPDCIPCVLRMAMGVARQVLQDDQQVMALLHEVLGSPHFAGGAPVGVGPGSFGGPVAQEGADGGAAGTGRRSTPRAPEVVCDVWLRLTEITGEADMLRDEKARQNNAILSLYPGLQGHVQRHADLFVAALRLAVMGNALDMMVDTGTQRAAGPGSLAAVVDAAESATIDGAAVEVFRGRVARAGSIVYFGDNCGEVVLDRLFVEAVRRARGWTPPPSTLAPVSDAAPEASNGLDVVFVTRSLPSGNDVTPLEAEAVGMGEVARILPNGIPVPLPGTDLSLCSDEVRRLVHDADLVISKGGGNFELLDEEEVLAGKVTYLLHGKCRPLCGATGVGPGDLVVANR